MSATGNAAGNASVNELESTPWLLRILLRVPLREDGVIFFDRFLANGTLGIFHGMKSYFCQDKYGQIAPVYSISAGLDYPGIGPEHANLSDTGRAKYVPVTDEEAVNAFEYLSRTEGIIPAIESAHAVAHCIKLAPTMSKDSIIVVNLSGRGDKDVAAIARYRGENIYE